MKTKFFFQIFGLFVLVIVFGCEKNEDYIDDSNSKVELYLIDSYSRIANSCQIDENTVIAENSPLIYYSDFLSYDPKEYLFELSERAIEAIKDLEHSVYGLAFAVKANDTLIYTGYFWPSSSSASCNWTVIDPFTTYIGNKVQIRLGYPGLFQGQVIQDKRNDNRILGIFKQDNKLK